jgi:hypothetical protein
MSSDNEENVKLAANIIKANVDEDNFIAIVCIVRNAQGFNVRWEIDTDIELHAKISKLIQSKSPVKEELKRIRDYSNSDLLQLALYKFDSKDNIEYARDNYINYINNICDLVLDTPKPNADDQRSPSDK